ncbi:hypothetical protein R50072_28190 [Simiduia litorea]|uniref:hypothetical protein n=1 Tax=Simiduia litorea TaxID=1435348 RepID=UPI0036F3981E
MKFIDERSIRGNPYSYIGLLKKKGILAKHNSEFQNAPHGHLNRKGVWILLDHQHVDAVQLIGNPNHVASDPISEEEMASIEEAAKAEFYKTSSVFFGKVGVSLVYISLIGMSIFILIKVV